VSQFPPSLLCGVLKWASSVFFRHSAWVLAVENLAIAASGVPIPRDEREIVLAHVYRHVVFKTDCMGYLR